MEYLTISEYARKMGVSRQAIQQRIKNGTLATVIKSKKVKLIPYDSIAPCKVEE